MDNFKFLHRPWKPEDFRLGTTMSDYWVNFITGSDPNGKGLPEWPKFNTQNYSAMVFDTISGAQTIPDKNELSFMMSVLDK
jgi:para-nitrobenzyl esterase